MPHAIYCTDKPESMDIRMANRPAHLDYAKGFADKLLLVGPLQDDAGEKMLGSLLVLDVEDRAEAEAFAANDPYAKAGLFESVVIRRIKIVDLK